MISLSSKIKVILQKHFICVFRWPRLKHQEYHYHELPQCWMLLAQERMEIAIRVLNGLNVMSASCYPHGEPSLSSLDARIANDPLGFVEDELVEILFCTDEYMKYISIFE